MSMFLQENTGLVPLEDDDDELSSGGDNEALDEDGILSAVKKFYSGSDSSGVKKSYSGSDSSDVSDLTEQLNKATTKAEVQKVIDKIEKSLEHTEKWLKGSAFEHFAKGGLIRNSYANSEDNKKKIKQESNLLKGLKSRAQGKLRSLKN